MKVFGIVKNEESSVAAFKQLYSKMINAGYESIYFKEESNKKYEAILHRNGRSVKISTSYIEPLSYRGKISTIPKSRYYASIQFGSDKIKIESEPLNLNSIIKFEKNTKIDINISNFLEIINRPNNKLSKTSNISRLSRMNSSRSRILLNKKGGLFMSRTKNGGFNEIKFFRGDSTSFIESNSLVTELESCSSDVNENKYHEYEILYGTNRLVESFLDEIQFTNKRDSKLHFGSSVVSIPSSHKIGKIERPDWFSNLIFEESKNKHFTVLETKELNEYDFIDDLKIKTANSTDKDVLLFIHGFNVNFKEAMMRTAQLGFDLNFKGAVTAFSWPSVGGIFGYEADYSTAEFSSQYLSDFIKLLTNKDVNKLHIIAHSMGNVVLTKAIEKLKIEGNYPNKTINQIILAAPDIDKDVFVNQIMPAIKSDIRLTLYASKKDNALLASKKLRYNYPRAGDGGKNIIVVDGIQTVDASKVNTGLLGHGYFAGTQALINDIHMVLQGLHPNKRILDEKRKIVAGFPKIYWAFRNS